MHHLNGPIFDAPLRGYVYDGLSHRGRISGSLLGSSLLASGLAAARTTSLVEHVFPSFQGLVFRGRGGIPSRPFRRT